MAILLIEDDSEIREHVTRVLEEQNWDVLGFPDLDRFDLAQRENTLPTPSLLLLDRLLGDRDSLAEIPRLKDLPEIEGIVVLSAIGTPGERAEAIEMGADDYVTKPFESVELCARLRALQRRIHSPRDLNLRVGDLTLDPLSRVCRLGDASLGLTNKEFMVVLTLARTPGKVFSKYDLMEMVWGVSAATETKSVEVTIKNLRRKFEDVGTRVRILNERSLGYWIET